MDYRNGLNNETPRVGRVCPQRAVSVLRAVPGAPDQYLLE
jgi:hypothetical protein